MAFQNPTFSSLLAAFLCLTVFYFLFRWRFGKETFWQANRVYLLFVPFLAWVIPHLQVQLTPASPLSEAIDPALLIQLLQLRQEAEGWFTAEQAPERSIPLGDLLLWVYAGGVLWNISMAIIKTSRILYLAHLGERQDFGSFTLVSNARISGPASFFRFVFSPPQQPVSGMVLEHELAHVRQGHSFDILLMELWVALHWYNPLIYRMRRHLQATHEYIADAAVVSRSEGAYAYARLLISQPQNRVPMLYNTFAAQISSRLRMLARRPSARWKLVAHAITLPLAAGLGLFFSVQVIEATPMPEAFKPIASALDRLEHARIDASTLPFSAPAEEKEASVESMEPEKTARIADLRMLPSAAFPEICSQLVGTDTLPPASTIRIEIASDSAKTKSSGLKNVLVVVDGEIKTGTDGDEIIKTMDPGDIQSIEVLKGESAIAIYGEKGREGVIMITTKKGKANQPAPNDRQ
ncbi:MAG: TonB-dependent receptor plug domain-containing protein [Haliscomenobacter sp.]|nr:TonB-dependent receptor plug domain-containing protein [Haliscomenobacter sp.]